MSIIYTAVLPAYMGKLIDLGSHIFITTADFDVSVPPETTLTIKYRTSEYYMADYNFDIPFFDRLENLNNFTTVYGSWAVSDVLFEGGAIDRQAVISTSYGDRAINYLKHPTDSRWDSSIVDFEASVTANIEDPYKKWYSRQYSNQAISWPNLTNSTTIKRFTFLPEDLSASLYVGDIVRMYDTDATYEEFTISTVHTPGTYYYGGGNNVYEPDWYCDFSTDTAKNYTYFGSYLTLASRPSGNPGGNAYIAFGYDSTTGGYYLAGVDISTQKYRIGRYDTGTASFIWDEELVDIALTYLVDHNIKVTSKYSQENDETAISLEYSSVLKLTHTYSGKICGKIGLANNNSKTYFNDLYVNANRYFWTDWAIVTNTSVIPVFARARKFQFFLEYTGTGTDISAVPRISGITFNGMHSNTCALNTDTLWARDTGTLPWYTVYNGKDVGLPTGEYVQLRFTLR